MKTEIIEVGAVSAEVVFHDDNVIDGYVESAGYVEIVSFVVHTEIGEIASETLPANVRDALEQALIPLINEVAYA